MRHIKLDQNFDQLFKLQRGRLHLTVMISSSEAGAKDQGELVEMFSPSESTDLQDHVVANPDDAEFK